MVFGAGPQTPSSAGRLATTLFLDAIQCVPQDFGRLNGVALGGDEHRRGVEHGLVAWQGGEKEATVVVRISGCVAVFMGLLVVVG